MARNAIASRPTAPRRAAPLLLVALAALSSVSASSDPAAPKLPKAPAAPVQPAQPILPGLPSLQNRYVLPKGQTHEGELRLLTGSAVIEGKQIGNVWMVAGSLEVPGEVTGKIQFWGSDLKISGTVEGDVEGFGSSVVLTGLVGKSLAAKAGDIDLAKESRVAGRVSLRCGQAKVHGRIDGSLDAVCGQIVFGGTVGGDADLEADALTIEPSASVAGEFVHDTRVPVDEKVAEILERKKNLESDLDRFREQKRHIQEDLGVRLDHGRVAHDRIGAWFGFLILATLLGLLGLAVFRGPRGAVLASVGADPLRNVGFGFLTIVVVPVALALSCILIVTIPFAALSLLLFALLVYLAQAPVAVWIGRFALAKMRRPDASPYVALLVGMPILYLVFALPWCFGPLFVFAALCLGTGAMVFGTRDWWRARKAARAIVAAQSAPAPVPPGPPPGSAEAPAPPPPENDTQR